jgi:protein tyrosine/serine phosphatase
MTRRLAALSLALALLATGCAAHAPTHLTGSTGVVFAEPVPAVPGIVNFAWVGPGVARGEQPEEESLRWLRDHGFRTVIDLRKGHDERAQVEKVGMTSILIPLRADLLGSTAPTEEQVRTFFDAVLDSTRRPVFFHCRRGSDRTGMFAALYRIEVDGWSNDQAIEEMKAYGYNGYYKALIGYVRNYRPRGYAQKR